MSYSPFAKCISEGNVMASHNQFEENYHGILTHNGEIKVAKGDREQEILYIDDDGIVLVDGGKKAYQTTIHSNLLNLIHYATAGDIGFVKFIRGEPFIVGFRKRRND
ncbi:MAG: hypothetical protein IJG19_04585 [Methanobrevibacter sp.]|nr:hypothetical protein [Methanobrevibacter sp.]